MIKAYTSTVPNILSAQSTPAEFEAFHRSTMNADVLAVYDALQMKGYEAEYAKGKGGGFWIKGEGYKSFAKCAKLAGVAIARKPRAKRQPVNLITQV